MADEQPEKSEPNEQSAPADGAEVDLDSIRVYLSLDLLGELVGAVARKFATMRGAAPLDSAGVEGRELALFAWHYVCHMSDRVEFEASVVADLAALDTSDTE